jgi:molybdate transport system regulatory protein
MATARNKPVAKFRIRVTAGDVIAIGPGKIALLEAISETGYITAAAKSLDMSYRRAWMLLDELNRALRKPAVDSAKGGQHGGGSELTEVGRQLIDTYRRIEETASRACAADIKRLVGLIAS